MNRDEVIRAQCPQSATQRRYWNFEVSDVLYLLDETARLRSELESAQKITGDTSDGYHTFNELYHHRALLFSVICNDRPDMAWKSRKHHDGTMYDGMFVVGIQTPDGQATYHYDVDPYWDVFDVPELEAAPEWDGHTPAQAIERISGLRSENEWEEAYSVQSDVNRRLDAENRRLRADLASMTAERDALNHCFKYERGAKAAFEIRWRAENAKYNKSVVHLQRARGQRDTLNVELERMQKEVDKLPTYESANSGLHDKLCAAAAERDAFKDRAEAAERDVNYMLRHKEPNGECECCGMHTIYGCDADDCEAEACWRGPDAGGEGKQ